MRNNKNLSSDIREAEVHFVFSIGEKSEAGNLVGHPFDLRLIVGSRKANENQKSAIDFSGRPLTNADLRARDPLEQNSQALLDGY